jgi:hypothetical protein
MQEADPCSCQSALYCEFGKSMREEILEKTFITIRGWRFFPGHVVDPAGRRRRVKDPVQPSVHSNWHWRNPTDAKINVGLPCLTLTNRISPRPIFLLSFSGTLIYDLLEDLSKEKERLQDSTHYGVAVTGRTTFRRNLLSPSLKIKGFGSLLSLLY